ncbi:tetratricopeptide repeat protein [Candidatus Gracilibacteria bacterium]|jgi:tetratricopeptide (TPR) repeat protein|nr:tetratricopeptide repeat protein [Candidatus Gracilibacteria bacterium]
MKKIIISLLAVSLLLSGCASAKWDKKDPNAPAAYYQKHEQQLKDNQAKLDKDPTNFTLQFEKAFQLQALGRYKEAVKEYEKALAMAPDDFATLNNLAAIYEEVGEIEKALTYEQKLYNQNTTNIEVLKDTIRLLTKNKQFSDAQGVLDTFAGTEEGKKEGAFLSEQMTYIKDETAKEQNKK